MDIDQWEAMKDGLRRKFEFEEEAEEELKMDTADGEVIKGSANFVVMSTPIGRVKLAFEKKPLVLDKHEHFSHRAGEAPRTEYKFSDTEFSYKLKAYKWNDIDETWNPIDADSFK